jgi:hypothetical protein
MRSEKEIFDDLAKLCASPGYAHAIALFCYRDNVIGFGETLQAKDVLKQYNWSRLIRTEISTLIGLFAKAAADYSMPNPAAFARYIEETERLMHELHESMAAVWRNSLSPESLKKPGFNPFANAQAMREPIFYGGEAAYIFQYRDHARPKYTSDNCWLSANKGFTIDVAASVVAEICKIQNDKLMPTLTALRQKPMEEWTMLPAFVFSQQEVCHRTQLDKSLVSNVLQAFTHSKAETNSSFCGLADFNVTNAQPIFECDDETYLLFQSYNLVESLYDSPFFWMAADKNYRDSASKHRGQFTEQFSKERLCRVFGKYRVYCNVEIINGKGENVSEIDVLVVFGNRALVLQAKSKRLTIEARKGNDLHLKADFKAAIQSSYDQALACSQALLDSSLGS